MGELWRHRDRDGDAAGLERNPLSGQVLLYFEPEEEGNGCYLDRDAMTRLYNVIGAELAKAAVREPAKNGESSARARRVDEQLAQVGRDLDSMRQSLADVDRRMRALEPPVTEAERAQCASTFHGDRCCLFDGHAGTHRTEDDNRFWGDLGADQAPQGREAVCRCGHVYSSHAGRTNACTSASDPDAGEAPSLCSCPRFRTA